ncbi:MAG: YegS/Rv2252/BmrU family lipid kinase [Chitinophagaceae bacterium]|nr:YegS/Rv2252/BmrU family lipid kinase [Chitinophagaceae bacterium]
MSILFVINPVSGGKSNIDWEAVITEFYSTQQFTINICLLSGENDESSVKDNIEKCSPDIVVAVGGDGTVGIVAKLILGTPIALGIIPAGSANGMAKELEIPGEPAEAMKIIANGKTKDADVIKINDEHICLHLSDIGLNARLIKYFEEGNMRGKIGYASKVMKTLWTKSLMKVNIVAAGEETTHAALMVVLANASKYGTGAVINPGGNLYDGLFEVVIMRRLAFSELLKMWFRPQPFDPKKIRVVKATSVTIETSKKVHFQVDGEYLGKINYLKAKILPAQLKIVVP